ncbi:MAG: hypothetical protein HY313_04015 [Acidobacteria bacterium]|nr:hypothetical protein [Acidobacteriota bacterium]
MRITKLVLFPVIPALAFFYTSCSQEQPHEPPAVVSSTEQIPTASENATQETAEVFGGEETHTDHASKHGGVFFMALDDKYHLEGILSPPGKFIVYLYDAYTRPVSLSELKKTTGTVRWGESDDAPEIPLRVVESSETLEADIGKAVDFPITLTLLLKLPGMPSDAKPELFTFLFSHYSEQTPHDPHP